MDTIIRSTYVGLDGQSIRTLNLEGVPVIPPKERARKLEKNREVVHTLLQDSQLENIRKEPDRVTGGAVDFSLGVGLPPIPPRLVAKIRRGDFVEMHELLPDYWWALESEQEAAVQKSHSAGRQWVLDIRVWVQYFACHAGVVTANQPDLLAYLIQIVKASLEFDGPAWATYDETFRRQATATGDTQWSGLNPSLFSMCFIGKALSST